MSTVSDALTADDNEVKVPEVKEPEAFELVAVDISKEKTDGKHSNSQITRAFARRFSKDDALTGFLKGPNTDEELSTSNRKLSVKEELAWLSPSFPADAGFAGERTCKRLGQEAHVAMLSDSLGLNKDETQVLLEDFYTRHMARVYGREVQDWTMDPNRIKDGAKTKESAIEEHAGVLTKTLVDRASAKVEEVGFDKTDSTVSPDNNESNRPMTIAQAEPKEVTQTCENPLQTPRSVSRVRQLWQGICLGMSVLYIGSKRTLICVLGTCAAFLLVALALESLTRLTVVAKDAFVSQTQVAAVDQTAVRSVLLEAAQTMGLENLQRIEKVFDMKMQEVIARLAQEENLAVFKSEAMVMTDGIASIDITERVKAVLRQEFGIETLVKTRAPESIKESDEENDFGLPTYFKDKLQALYFKLLAGLNVLKGVLF